jgi:hypothetical protein
MKAINFIKALSPQEQKELRRWYVFSSIAVLITILSIIGIQAHQFYVLYQAQQHAYGHRLTPALMQEQEKLCQQEQELFNKIAILTTNTTQIQKLKEYLAALTKACTANKLESCDITPSTLKLCIRCASPQEALTLGEQLIATPDFASLKLVALQPALGTQKQYCATIAGELLPSATTTNSCVN